jgi:hypothetical protein
MATRQHFRDHTGASLRVGALGRAVAPAAAGDEHQVRIAQHTAVKHGKQIAFLGLNSSDKEKAARKFLSTRPLPFPSYTDGDSKIATKRKLAAYSPMTEFIGRDGKSAYTHTGPYTSEAQLTKDIERYLR